jgi:hypothetical protein
MKVSERKFKTAQNLIDFVKHQLSKEIKTDDTFKAKPKLGIVYMEINFDCPLRSLFGKYKIRTEHHIGNKYFVYLA